MSISESVHRGARSELKEVIMTADPSLAAGIESGHPARASVPSLAVVASPLTGSALTVMTPVEPSKLESLRQLLIKIGEDVEHETELHLRDLRLVHFLRWVIVPPAEEGQTHLLVYGSDFDGTRAEHLHELFRVSGAGLNKIYAHCIGSPRFEKADDLRQYFEANRLEASASYSGTRDRSAREIVAEDELEVAISNYLDTKAGRKAAQKNGYDAVKEFVASMPKPPLDVTKPPRSTESVLSRLLHGPAFWPLVVIAGSVVAVPTLFFAGAVKLREWTEKDDVTSQSEAELQALEKLKNREDHRGLVQNQLTHVVAIKPGWFRMRTLKLVLWSIDFLAKHYYNQGNLGGIPSIHYARWMILEKRRQLLFFSNFDGSWESYLGDFVDQAARGLTSVWSNTVGFPRASFLLEKGARDEERFKNWTRRHQIETQIWYSAYPSFTVQNVNDNTKLRAGLARKPEGEAFQAWLRTL
jgi:hypothetical protein